MQRPDWKTTIKIPLAPIPSGTSNALAATMGLSSVPMAAFAVAKGFYRAMDLVSVFQDQKRYFSFLSLTWSSIADIDIGTENIRWMGAMRNYFGALKMIAMPKFYDAILRYVPPPAGSDRSLASPSPPASQVPEDVDILRHSLFLKAQETTLSLPYSGAEFQGGPDCPVLWSSFPDFRAIFNAGSSSSPSSPENHDHKSKQISSNSSGQKEDGDNEGENENKAINVNNNHNGHDHNNHDLSSNSKSGGDNGDNSNNNNNIIIINNQNSYLTIREKFCYFLAGNISHIASDMRACPESKPSDGKLSLIYMTGTKATKANMLKLLVGVEKGEYTKFNFINSTSCVAFSLEPITAGSFVAMDGELISYQKTFGEVHQGLCNVISF